MAGEAVGKSHEKIEPKKMTLERSCLLFFFFFFFLNFYKAIAPYRAAVCHGNSFDMSN